MSNFIGDFQDKSDIVQQFQLHEHALDNVDILLASYECADYEGSAFVLFEEDGKLYEVNGSHCSCYGLEGQWQPEETLVEALVHRITVGQLGNSYYSGSFGDDLLKILESRK